MQIQQVGYFVFLFHVGILIVPTSLREKSSGRKNCLLLSCSYKCNKPGHFARDCEGETVCRNCSEPGHLANECPNPPVCRNCGQSGHIAKDCPNEVVCRRCGQPGHFARECSE